MSENKVKTINVDGVKVDITVTGSGMFYAQLDGEGFQKPTLKELEELMRKMIRNRGKLSIEATLVEIVDGWRHEGKVEFENIVITGTHAGNNNILYRDANGHTSQLRGYNDGRLCKRLSTDEKKELVALVVARNKATAAVDEWVKGRTINAAKTIDEARKKGTIE